MRLDVFLVSNCLCESRNKATQLIRNGRVKVNGAVIKKASSDVDQNDLVEIDSSKVYVARSAYKLITAIEKFALMFDNKVAVDLGSSTGGFCQVMLENNVEKIYAVDVGTNQLHNSLRSDDRVVVKENTNARYLEISDFDSEIDFVTCDLSFISVKHILDSVYKILKTNGEFVCLVKPQFEVGHKFINKNGVVKNKNLQVLAVQNIIDTAASKGFSVYDICFSGLEGESGNKEFLIYMKKDCNGFKIDSLKVSAVINEVI